MAVFDSEPFGQRSVRLGFATSEQVRLAVETQRLMEQKSGLLGEILVEMGWLDPQHYMEVVQALVEESSEGDRSHEEIQEEFIRLALEKGYADETSVTQAKKIQDRINRRDQMIGQIMVEMGFLDPESRKQILATYKNDVERS